MFEPGPDAVRAWNALSERQRADAWRAARAGAPTPDPRIASVVIAYARTMMRATDPRTALLPVVVSLVIVLAMIGLVALGLPTVFTPLGILAIVTIDISYRWRKSRRSRRYTRLASSGLQAIKAAPRPTQSE